MSGCLLQGNMQLRTDAAVHLVEVLLATGHMVAAVTATRYFALLQPS